MFDKTIEISILKGRIKLLQPATGFHASIDTVFLAAAAEVKERHKLLDIGCGVGSAGLCVMARNAKIAVTGIDVQPELIELAQRNAVLNGVENKCEFFHGNILTESQVPDNTFNAAIMNPPYYNGGTESPHKIKAVSHVENASGATLTDWIKYAHKKLKNGGHLTLVHRADRLDEVVVALTAKRWFGSLVILPLLPYAGEDAKRVIVRARKERYAPLQLKAGLILHGPGGAYTDAAEDVLSRACALS
jgi:tRNA1(Val) A37 N6-methylase TrmN6